MEPVESNFVSREGARVATEDEQKEAWYHTALGQRLLRRMAEARKEGKETVSIDEDYELAREMFNAGWQWGKLWAEAKPQAGLLDITRQDRGFFN